MGLSHQDSIKGPVVTMESMTLAGRATKPVHAQAQRGIIGVQGQAGTRYDLLLRGGEFIDPGSGRRGQLDVAFAEDKAAAIGPSIDPALARQVESVTGCMVVPGVIDMHAHAADGIGPSCNPDVIGVSRGVTTILDGGSCGAGSFRIFRYVIAPNKIRVLAMLNLSVMGLIDTRAGEFILENLIGKAEK